MTIFQNFLQNLMHAYSSVFLDTVKLVYDKNTQIVYGDHKQLKHEMRQTCMIIQQHVRTCSSQPYLSAV